MAKCNDCWCEHYDKNRGKCDSCIKKETEKNHSALSVLLNKRTVNQMQINDKNKTKTQIR